MNLTELHAKYDELVAAGQKKEASAIRRKINYQINRLMTVKPAHNKPLPTNEDIKNYLLASLTGV